MSLTTKNKLEAGETLHPSEELRSNSLIYRAVLSKDGDFCLILGDGEAVWSIGKKAETPTGLVMQGDGNLVAYCYEGGTSGHPYWSTQSSKRNCHLDLGDDGALAIIDQDGKIVTTINGDYKGNIEAITVENAVYDIANATISDPKTIIGQKISVSNDDDIDEESDAEVSIETSESSSWSKTLGGSASVTLGGKAGLPFVAEGKVSVSASVDFHYQWGSTTTQAKTFSATVRLTVPAHKTYWATLVAQTTQFSCNYTMTGTVTAGGVTRPWKYSGTFEGENSHDWSVHYGHDGSEEAIAVIPVKVIAAPS